MELSHSLDRLKVLKKQDLSTSEVQLKHWDTLTKNTSKQDGPKCDEEVSVRAFGCKACNVKMQGSFLQKIFILTTKETKNTSLINYSLVSSGKVAFRPSIALLSGVKFLELKVEPSPMSIRCRCKKAILLRMID